jgi:hypothetical protein
MRKFIFVLGWVVLVALPLVFIAHAVWIQDLPHVAAWQWAVPFAAALVIYFSRNRDDVLRHHLG